MQFHASLKLVLASLHGKFRTPIRDNSVTALEFYPWYRFILYFCILFSDNKTAIATDLASCNLNNACAAHGRNFNLLQFSEEVEKSYKHWSGDKSESEIEFARVVEWEQSRALIESFYLFTNFQASETTIRGVSRYMKHLCKMDKECKNYCKMGKINWTALGDFTLIFGLKSMFLGSFLRIGLGIYIFGLIFWEFLPQLCHWCSKQLRS